MNTEERSKQAGSTRPDHDPVRAICRAVIRRVRQEYPGSFGYDLFLRLSCACPFVPGQDQMLQVWDEEVLAATALPGNAMVH